MIKTSNLAKYNVTVELRVDIFNNVDLESINTIKNNLVEAIKEIAPPIVYQEKVDTASINISDMYTDYNNESTTMEFGDCHGE